MSYSKYFKITTFLLLVYFVVVTIIAFFLITDLVFFKEFLSKIDIKNLPEKLKISFFFRIFCDFGKEIEKEISKFYEAENSKDIAKFLIELSLLEKKVTYTCFVWILVLYSFGIVLFFMISIFSYRRIMKSLKKLTKGFERIMNHDYGYQVSLGGDFKEFKESIILFNKASKGIKTFNEELLNALKEWGEK